jgi:hypothetical protein
LNWQHWFFRHEKIYSNYHLFGIPYFFIKAIDQLETARDGFLALDELWRCLDAYEARSIKARVTADILSKSRKRGLTYCLHPDELILTDMGLKEISKITEKDKVLSHNGRFMEVTDTFSRQYDGTMFTILPSKLHIPLRLTDNHEVMVYRRINDEDHIGLEELLQKHEGESIRLTDLLTEFSNGNKPSGSKYELAKFLCEKYGIELVKDDTAKTKYPYLLVYPKHKIEFFKTEWCMSQDIENKDYLVYPIITNVKDISSIKVSDFYNIKEKNGLGKDKYIFNGKEWIYPHRNLHIKNDIEVNNDFMEFCGYYLSEGSFDGSSISLAFNIKEKHLSERTIQLFKNVFGINAKHRTIEKSNVIIVRAYGKPIGEMLSQLFGCGCINKTLPSWMMYLPTEKQECLLKAYEEGDGYFNEKRRCNTIVTTSKNMAIQLYQIALRLNKIPSLNKHDNAKSNNPIYTLSYYDDGQMRGKIKNGKLFIPILRIEKEHYNGLVHNMEVKEDNSYTTFSMCVHNCFTAQVLNSLSLRIRMIIDFCSYPILNRDESVLKILIFRGNRGRKENYLKSVYFRTSFIHERYDTNEEVEMEVESGEQPKIVFQAKFNPEHGYCCECDECGTKFFKTWEEADRWAEMFWKQHQREIRI